MSAYDILKEHIKDQLQACNSNEVLQLDDLENERSRLQINIMNADIKLQKYRALLTSPVYYIAVVLVPWIKWEYFEDHMTAEELLTAKKVVQKFWDDEYSGLSIGIEESLAELVQPQVSFFNILTYFLKLTNYSQLARHHS
jgi:hypothetical protein